MKGVQRLKVPETPRTPKLYVMTLTWQGKQHRFIKVAWGLAEAIDACYCFNTGHRFTMNDYINHSELSVGEINQLFKNFQP